MARVVLTTDLCRRFAVPQAELEISGETVRQIIRNLDRDYPGLGKVLSQTMAVAIDGEIFADPFLEPTGAEAEVYFLPKLGGGRE